VRPLFLLLTLLPLALFPLARAQTAPAPAPETPPAAADAASYVVTPALPPSAPVPSPTWVDGLVLGLVEGITEFLPISSTGHLIIASEALGLDSAHPVQVPGAEEPVPFKQATDAFIVIIQIGAIAAVVVLYWRRILGILAGLVGRDAAGLRLGLNILVACIPAGVLGLLLGDWIDEHLFSIPAVAASLVAGALLMFWVEARRRRAVAAAAPADRFGSGSTTLETLQPRQALLIGGMQCLALWPGTSRSMVTIVGGYLAGLPPALAAEFSFLVGLPLLSAAALLKTYRDGAAVLAAFGPAPIAVGLVVAALSAALAVRFLVGFLTRHGLAAFAWYRIALAAILLLFILS
jgi:undecaprenyl-diphosphatase